MLQHVKICIKSKATNFNKAKNQWQKSNNKINKYPYHPYFSNPELSHPLSHPLSYKKSTTKPTQISIP
jgi:hypothetical protein